MKDVSRSLAFCGLLLATTLQAGCSEQITSQYTPKNMLVGAAIGLLIAVIAGLLSKKKDKDKDKE